MTVVADRPRKVGDDPRLARGASADRLLDELAAIDRATLSHSWRVARLAMLLARAVIQCKAGTAEDRADLDPDDLCLGAVLHDIGKIGVPRRILLGADPLSDADREEMEKHPSYGAAKIGAYDELAAALPVVLYHHERWDGRGYPFGLIGHDIPFAARIVAVADTYDAITFGRPYAPAQHRATARFELLRGAGSQFDPDIVRAFDAIDRAELDRVRCA